MIKRMILMDKIKAIFEANRYCKGIKKLLSQLTIAFIFVLCLTLIPMICGITEYIWLSILIAAIYCANIFTRKKYFTILKQVKYDIDNDLICDE
jgi:hypothetical protein